MLRIGRHHDFTLVWGPDDIIFSPIFLSIMAPLYKRPLDLFIVFVFAQFLFIAITIGKLTRHVTLCCFGSFSFPADFVQSVYGSFLATKNIQYGYWPPAAVVDAYAWWCENVDVLLAHNPIWFVVHEAPPPSHV